MSITEFLAPQSGTGSAPTVGQIQPTNTTTLHYGWPTESTDAFAEYLDADHVVLVISTSPSWPRNWLAEYAAHQTHPRQTEPQRIVVQCLGADRIKLNGLRTDYDSLSLAYVTRRWERLLSSQAARLQPGITGRADEAAQPIAEAGAGLRRVAKRVKRSVTELAGRAAIEPVVRDSEVQAVAQSVSDLSGLSDAKIAELLPKASRETFNRWKHGRLTNPNDVNWRALNRLAEVLAELDLTAVTPKRWLQQSLAESDTTPYDLLRLGRLTEVRELIAQLPSPEDWPEGKPVPRSRAPLPLRDPAGSAFDDELDFELVEVEIGELDDIDLL